MESSPAATGPDDNVTIQADAFARNRADPDEFRASLEAVRAAQSAADTRDRHATYLTRLLVVAAMAGVGIMAWNRSARHPHRTLDAVAAPTVASVVAAPPVAAAVLVAPAAAADPTAGVPATEPTPVVPATDTVASLQAAKECDDAFTEHRWQSVTTDCAAAFKQRPRDSALAMRVAQAQHRLGYIADAGEWASRAIALDASLPEAFAIKAHAATLAGDSSAAVTAYRRYLALAPHGWHSAEARHALGRSSRRQSHNTAAP